MLSVPMCAFSTFAIWQLNSETDLSREVLKTIPFAYIEDDEIDEISVSHDCGEAVYAKVVYDFDSKLNDFYIKTHVIKPNKRKCELSIYFDGISFDVFPGSEHDQENNWSYSEPSEHRSSWNNTEHRPRIVLTRYFEMLSKGEFDVFIKRPATVIRDFMGFRVIKFPKIIGVPITTFDTQGAFKILSVNAEPVAQKSVVAIDQKHQNLDGWIYVKLQKSPTIFDENTLLQFFSILLGLGVAFLADATILMLLVVLSKPQEVEKKYNPNSSQPTRQPQQGYLCTNTSRQPVWCTLRKKGLRRVWLRSRQRWGKKRP